MRTMCFASVYFLELKRSESSNFMSNIHVLTWTTWFTPYEICSNILWRQLIEQI